MSQNHDVLITAIVFGVPIALWFVWALGSAARITTRRVSAAWSRAWVRYDMRWARSMETTRTESGLYDWREPYDQEAGR